MEEEEMDIPTLMGGMTHEMGPHEIAGQDIAGRENGKHENGTHELYAHESTPTEPIAEPFLPYMVTSAIAEAENAPVVEPEPPAVVGETPEAHIGEHGAHVSEHETPIGHEPRLAEHEVPLAGQEVEAAATQQHSDTAPPTAVSAPLPEEDVYESGDPDDTDGPEPGEEAAPVHHLDNPAPAPAFPTGEPAPFPFSLTPLSHDFTFEPLHTVDYFASQGIKLELEENPTDKLTRNLKSFTEWLKTMKRISPVEARHTDLDAATEAEIQQLASSANHQREAVLTESMAHVWVLQGKIHKAVEVYNKLSLQHPEKRAYFAAKIEQLNRL
jgi:hypothetical protein